jgi:hypothetical protein
MNEYQIAGALTVCRPASFQASDVAELENYADEIDFETAHFRNPEVSLLLKKWTNSEPRQKRLILSIMEIGASQIAVILVQDLDSHG